MENMGTLPNRFGRLCESIELTITYLQRKMTIEAETNWCSYVISLGMLPKLLRNEKFKIQLPTWFSQESYKHVIDAIKKTKKTVNIEQEDGTRPRVLENFPDIVAEQNGNGKLIKVTTIIRKMENKEPKKMARDNNDEGSGKNTADDDLNDAQDYSQGARRKETSPNTRSFHSGKIKQGEGFNAKESGVFNTLSRRARQGVEFNARESGEYDRLFGKTTKNEGFQARNSDVYDKLLLWNQEKGTGDLLDNNIPTLPDEVILMPRHLSPPRTLPSAPPYPWNNPPHNTEWDKHLDNTNLVRRPGTKVLTGHADGVDFSQLKTKIDNAISKFANQTPKQKAISKFATRPIIREPVYEEIKEITKPDAKKPTPQYHFEVQKDQTFGLTNNLQPEKENKLLGTGMKKKKKDQMSGARNTFQDQDFRRSLPQDKPQEILKEQKQKI